MLNLVSVKSAVHNQSKEAMIKTYNNHRRVIDFFIVSNLVLCFFLYGWFTKVLH